MTLYALYLLVVVAGSLEAALRLGLVDSEPGRMRRLIEASGAGPRLLVLGDSFSVETPGAFAVLLQDHMRKNGVSLLNLARPGFGPRRYLEMLRRYGLDYHPDLILLGYYAGNDLSDTLYSRTGAAEIARHWLSRSFLGAKLIEVRDAWIISRRLAAVRTDLSREGPEPPGEARLFLIELSRAHPEFFLTNLLLETPGSRDAWETIKRTLIEIRGEAAGIDARLVILIFPASVQVDERYHPAYREMGFRLDERVLAESLPQDLLREFCGENGIECLDLLPAFRARGSEDLYQSPDPHWNGAGNRLAFDLAREFLDARIPEATGRREGNEREPHEKEEGS